MSKQTIRIAATGHRPNRLGGYCADNPVRLFIRKELKKILECYKERYDRVIGIHGLALGFDTDFANTCLELKIPYEAYAPFKDQDSKWFAQSQEEYRFLVNNADKFIIVSEGSYSPAKMHERNKVMVDKCDLLISCWNGDESGGTWNCIKYAEKKGVRIININPKDYKSGV
jgi:uncharacterized phage-like protein YoqJ